MTGKIVPAEITVNLLKNAMEKAGWAEKRFLVDGFPRNEDNYVTWNKIFGDSVNVKGSYSLNAMKNNSSKGLCIVLRRLGATMTTLKR